MEFLKRRLSLHATTFALAFGFLAVLGDRVVNYGTVALGLGFVIFWHELGHFLMAKWNDVKVEKFSVGFGPALVKFQRGETEYALSAVPLGGFVKMLGEGEEVAGEIQKTEDPRAYSNKSVGARMAIISAGVIMNLILGVACFVFAYGHGGLEVAPAVIEYVMAGSPAYDAGLRPGDRIVGINGRRDVDFLAMKRITAFSGPGQALHLELERPGRASHLRIDVVPRLEPGNQMKTMGIRPPLGVTLAKPPFKRPVGMTASADLGTVLRPDDRITAVGPRGGTAEPVKSSLELMDALSRWRDQPLDLAVERRGDSKAQPKTIHAELPVSHFVDFG